MSHPSPLTSKRVVRQNFDEIWPPKKLRGSCGWAGLGLDGQALFRSWTDDTQLAVVHNSMLVLYRRPSIAIYSRSFHWHIVGTTVGVTPVRCVGNANIRVAAPQPRFQMDKALTPQAFASNNLNRSTADKREAEFLRTALQHVHFVIVSGSKVMVSREPSVKLRWLEASELQNLDYSPSRDGMLEQSQRGELHAQYPYSLRHPAFCIS